MAIGEGRGKAVCVHCTGGHMHEQATHQANVRGFQHSLVDLLDVAQGSVDGAVGLEAGAQPNLRGAQGETVCGLMVLCLALKNYAFIGNFRAISSPHSPSTRSPPSSRHGCFPHGPDCTTLTRWTGCHTCTHTHARTAPPPGFDKSHCSTHSAYT